MFSKGLKKPRIKIRQSRWYYGRYSNLTPPDKSQNRNHLNQFARPWV